MGAAGIRTVSLEDYLHNPAYEHCEYIDGEVVELNVGTANHGRIQGLCTAKIIDYLSKNPLGSLYVELHCKLQIHGELRYRLPDICVILGPPVEGHPERAPELCIETRSPDDSVSDQIAKFNDYFANGCKLGWLILPEEKSVLVLTPGASPQVVRAGERLTGGELLPGLEIPVDELFA